MYLCVRKTETTQVQIRRSLKNEILSHKLTNFLSQKRKDVLTDFEPLVDWIFLECLDKEKSVV